MAGCLPCVIGVSRSCSRTLCGGLAVPLGMIGTVLICVANLYGPGLEKVFGMTPIPGMFWGLPFCFALGILLMDEVRKLIVRTYPRVSREMTRCPWYFSTHFCFFHSLSLRRWLGRIFSFVVPRSVSMFKYELSNECYNASQPCCPTYLQRSSCSDGY
jgi:Cation transporting ATPase, C-terminus